MPRSTLKVVHAHLTTRDPRLARLVKGLDAPAPSTGRDIYYGLLQSIVSQQLSVGAAATIFDRFLDLFDDRYPAPEKLSRMTPARLRTAGVSKQKAGYLKEVARFSLKKGMAYGDLQKMDDEEVIAYLTQIKGVGKWTVEMILMFPLRRPDVLPVDDVGIQNAMIKLYGLRSKGPALKKRMEALAEPWRPYRTVACKYLWKWKGVNFSI